MRAPPLPEPLPVSGDALDREKRELRKTMRERLRAPRDATASQAAGGAVASRVAASAPFRSAERVALYAALEDELPTRPLFDAVLAAGKTALFPRCIGDALEFAAVDCWDFLVAGAFATLEPPPTSPALHLDRADLVVVPGLAFDAGGGRLGRGRGFYDRCFAAVDRPFLCGVAYAEQLVERVPMGRYDVRVNAIATEHGWHDVGSRA